MISGCPKIFKSLDLKLYPVVFERGSFLMQEYQENNLCHDDMSKHVQHSAHNVRYMRNNCDHQQLILANSVNNLT